MALRLMRRKLDVARSAAGLLAAGVLLTALVTGCSSSQPSDQGPAGGLGDVTPTATIAAPATATPAPPEVPTPTPAPERTPAPAPEPPDEPMAAIDREVLVAFYNATGGPDWIDDTNWLSELPIGQWQGVHTDAGGRVTVLSLSGNGLSGEIPSELSSLSGLRVLELRGNRLGGCIPAELREVPVNDLEDLTLPYCGEDPVREAPTTDVEVSPGPSPDREVLAAIYEAMDGPDWVDNTNWLSDEPIGQWWGVHTDADGRVTALNLPGNGLSGEIPSELASLSSLIELNLPGNRLEGGIPLELAGLSDLEVLRLSSNRLSGEIPSELASLSSLRVLNLFDNRLSGEIPSELSSLSNLEVLRLYSNGLSGEIPGELADLPNLTRLIISSNDLTGRSRRSWGDSPTCGICTSRTIS